MKTLPGTLGALYRSLARNDVFLLAAAISYAAILSFFPLLIGLIALLSEFVDPAQARRAIVRALDPYVPPGVISVVWATLEAAIRTRGAAGVVAILGLFWAATAVASAARHSLNKVLGAPRARPFWRRKGVEFAMVTLAGTLLSLSLITTGLAAIVRIYPALEAIAGIIRETWVTTVIAAVSPWVLSSAAFLTTYRFLPNVRVGWRSLLAGSVTGVVLFEATKLAFFWYLRTLGRYPIVYSYLAGVVVFMIWVYLVALVLLVGAEVAALVERRQREA